MNILFFIGNGFDLNLGMATRYKNFYEYYQKLSSETKSIEALKNEIDDNIENWSDLEKAFGEYTEKIHTSSEFDEVYEDIVIQLSNYLKEQENSFDFSKIESDKLKIHLANPENSLTAIDKQRITPIINKNLGNQKSVDVITFNYTKSLEKILNTTKLPMHIYNNGNIITSLQRIEHIHGYSEERLIMGVNDTSQISNVAFRKDINVLENIVKPECNKAQKHAVDDLCRNRISKAHLICVFGSSLGDTDNLWWNEIGRRLLQDCVLIIFARSSEEISPLFPQKQLRFERKIRKLFLSKLDIPENKKKEVESKIFVGINTNMFNLNGS